MRGTLEVTEERGLSLAEGTVWGALRQDDLDEALVSVQAACDAMDEPPEACDYVPALTRVLPGFLVADEDLNQDGQRDAYSVCLQVAASPEVLGGWPLGVE